MQIVQKTREDLTLVLETIEVSKNLKMFLANPLITVESKKNVLKNLLINYISPQVLNFLSILVERRRIIFFSSIVNCYLDLVNQLQLVTLAQVYTVIPLTNIQKQSLKDKLKTITNSDEIQLVININPELIGGFIVKIGSKVIDMSISGQLKQMSFYLNSTCL